MKQEDSHNSPSNHQDQDYVIEEGHGFWHRMDRRLEGFGEKLKKFSESNYWKPFKAIGNAAKAAWNSKVMTPVRWAVSKTASAINTVLKNPVVQFASFTAGLTLAAISLAAAAPVAVPLAAATVGIIAGGKVVSTAYEARKSYRREQVENQLKLLKALETTRASRDAILRDLPQEHKKAIEPNLTKRSQDQEIHKRDLKTKSQMIAEGVAANLLSVASTAMDFSQIQRTVRSASSVYDVLSTTNDTKSTLSKPVEISQEATETRKTENELRAEINHLSRKLDVPKVGNNAELRNFVANSVADTIALSDARRAASQGSAPEQTLETFQKTKTAAIETGTNLQTLPKPENKVKSAAIHVGKAFFGIPSENNVVTPPTRVQNVGNKKHDNTRNIG